MSRILFGDKKRMKRTYDYIIKDDRCVAFNSATGNIAVFRKDVFKQEEEKLLSQDFQHCDSLRFLLQNNFYETEHASSFYNKFLDNEKNVLLYCCLLQEYDINEFELVLETLVHNVSNIPLAVFEIHKNISSTYCKQIYMMLSTFVKKIDVVISDSSILMMKEWDWLRCVGEIMLRYDGEEDIYSVFINSNGWDIVLSLNANKINAKDIKEIIETWDTMQAKYVLDYSIGQSYIDRLGSTIDTRLLSGLCEAFSNCSMQMLYSFYKRPSNWCNCKEKATIKEAALSQLYLIHFGKCDCCNKENHCVKCVYNKICNYTCRVGSTKECYIEKYLNQLLFESKE